MQLHDVPTPGDRVQTIDVLRDEPREQSRGLELRQRVVSRIGKHAHEFAKADDASSPITPTGDGIADELAVLNRIACTRARARSAVIRDSRLGAAARAGE